MIPETDGKLTDSRFCVPDAQRFHSVDLTFISEKKTDVNDAINAALKAASEGVLKRILGYDENLLVAFRISMGNPLSSIGDVLLTKVVGQSVKVLSFGTTTSGAIRIAWWILIGFLEKKGL